MSYNSGDDSDYGDDYYGQGSVDFEDDFEFDPESMDDYDYDGPEDSDSDDSEDEN